MKANEAPEKVYFSEIENGTHYYTEGIPFEREYIEYIRTDVFIEKASTWISEHTSLSEKLVIEDFKNYIKGG